MGRKRAADDPSLRLELTKRQREVLELIAKGATNGQVAERLGITLDGAKWHVREILLKLGVDSREEAAAYWRETHGLGTRARAITGGVLGAMNAKWVALGTAMAFCVAGAAVVMVAMNRTGDAEPEPTPPATASPQAAPAGTPSLFAEELLNESSEAMAEIPVAVVETRAYERDGSLPDNDLGQLTFHYFEDRIRLGHGPSFAALCAETEPQPSPFSRRAGERLNSPPGAPPPEPVEMIREETYRGEDAWVIRWKVWSPSIEGPFPVEFTEWIARESRLLLRQEVESFDPFGFIGQEVRVFDYPDALPPCPDVLRAPAGEMTPVMPPRLTNPYP